MMLHTSPMRQGQTIEFSYGWHDRRLYRRVVNHSDGFTLWEVASETESDRLSEDWEAANGRPPINEWFLCDHTPGEGYQL